VDSIDTDKTILVGHDLTDSMNLSNFWNLGSQSDLKDGDSYGCLDGVDVFMEIADPARYRFMWYRCPDLNKHKDSAFLLSKMLVPENEIKIPYRKDKKVEMYFTYIEKLKAISKECNIPFEKSDRIFYQLDKYLNSNVTIGY
jgi:hypothetical protein